MVKSTIKKQPRSVRQVRRTFNRNNSTKSNKWNKKMKVHRNHNRNRNKNKNYQYTNKNRYSPKQLKKRRKRPRNNKLNLNKPDNIFNLSIVRSLKKPLMDLEILKKDGNENENENENETENDASPKAPTMDIDNEEKQNEESISHSIKMSNLPTNYEPGTTVELPQQINVRSWKSIQNTHNSKLIEFNPKCTQSFGHSMFYKREKNATKRIENQLRDEIRADKQLEQMKKQQRIEMRKQNMLKGLVVKPIRNMHKLKRFTKKQWKSVMKASVAIHVAKNAVRNTYVERQ